MRIPCVLAIATLAAAAAACSSSSDASDPGATGTGSDTVASADAGAGAVSFGGAQDFGDFREILGSGGIPGPDTLDANGFFNEHYAPPPATGCTSTLCLTPGLAVGSDWITGAPQATLQLAVDTNVDPTQYHRRPLDLVVVVDRSGSMAEDGRLARVQYGLGLMIDELQPGDRMAIVSFSDAVRVDAALAPLDTAALHATVSALAPGGGTNIYGGLSAGFDLLATPTPDREQRLVFMSDGLATVGDTSDTDIIAMSDTYISSGIGLTTIGVGADFDLALMRGLAEHGAGNFYFLEDDAATVEVFTQELAYFLSPIALDLSIEATAGPGYRFGEVVGSTLWTGTDTTGSMHIPAVFLASRVAPTDPEQPGARRGGGSMLFIALAPTGENPAPGLVGTVRLTYKLPGGGDPITQDVSLSYPGGAGEGPTAPYLSAPEIAPRYAMYNTFLGLRAATETSSLDCADALVRRTQEAATAWQALHEDDTDIGSDIGLMGEYLDNLATAGATATAATSVADACSTSPIQGGDAGTDYGSPEGSQPQQVGCMDAGGGRSTVWLGLALAAVVGIRRRRRR